MKFYYSDNGNVKMYSNGIIQYDPSKLSVIDITPTQNELDKINQNYIILIKDGKLSFEENIDKKKKDKINDIDKLLKKINKSSTIDDLKDDMVDLINIIQFNNQ